MTLIMTATPISMHSHQGHSMTATGWVISSHVIAMYLPSLATGGLIVRYGTRPVMAAGALLLGVAIGAGLLGVSLMHYWWSLVMLWLGWNFLFVGATALLTETYHPEERFKAQAYNDFGVFGASALASLASGALLH
jgi:MFS family permease